MVEDEALVRSGPLGDGPGAGPGVALGLQGLDGGLDQLRRVSAERDESLATTLLDAPDLAISGPLI